MQENNKRILKNSLFLYIRLLVTTVIGFYTSRVILEKLGVVDYGIYNVVGGIISLLATFNHTMSIASFRYMSIEIGKGNKEKLASIFSSSLIIHIFLAIVVVILCETIGLWFVSNKINIPQIRYSAAMWAYHLSVATSACLIVSSPYNNCILVHEKMDAYAILTIIDSFLKLLIVFFVGFCRFDNLIEYAILFCLVQIVMRISYGMYCKRKFAETRAKLTFCKKDIKEMFGFTSWNFLTVLANIGFSEGINILLNIFFGPTVNAARAIAEQIRTKLVIFARSIQDAINPQIIKNYGTGNIMYMFFLIINSSRYSFYMLYFFVLPLSLNIDFVLKFWLGSVPDNTPIFVILTLIFLLINVMQNALITTINATGKIKFYNIVESFVLFLIVPFTYVAFKFDLASYWAFIMQNIFMFVALLVSVFYSTRLIKMSIFIYVKKVWLEIFVVVLCSLPLPLLAKYIMEDGIQSFIIICVTSFVSVIFVIYKIGLTSVERENVKFMIKKRGFAHE